MKRFALAVALAASCAYASEKKSSGDSAKPAEVVGASAVSSTDDHGAKDSAPSGRKSSKYDIERIGSRRVGSGINAYSWEREVRLGRSMAETIESTARMQSDPLVNDYLNKLVLRLAAHSDAAIPFTVKVLDSDEINAFSLPGGFLYVNSGLLLAAEDEAQVAGVLAHEIAHGAARHVTRAKSKRFLVDAFSLPLSFVGPISFTAALAGPFSSLKFNRDAEREADLLGIQYLYSAGYDPAEFVRFFETLAGSQRKVWNPRVFRFLASEPGNEERLTNIIRIASAGLPPKDDYVLSSSDFDAAKSRLLELGGYAPLKSDDKGIHPRLRRAGTRPEMRIPQTRTSPKAEDKKLALLPQS